jgi:hypothetical protein
MPTLMDNEDKVDFQKRLKFWKDLKIRTFIIIDSNAYSVIKILKNHSYNMNNKDPKVLYDAIYRILTKTSIDSITTFIRELINININKFELLQRYLDYILFIDNKLIKSDIKMPKELISIVLLKGIEKSYKREIDHLSIALDFNQIDYMILKEYF